MKRALVSSALRPGLLPQAGIARAFGPCHERQRCGNGGRTGDRVFGTVETHVARHGGDGAGFAGEAVGDDPGGAVIGEENRILSVKQSRLTSSLISATFIYVLARLGAEHE